MSHGLEKIAQLAGVSKSTVSRVINDQPNVNQKTRERVLKIIREVNYRPNRAARALVTQHTRVLSVVIPQALASTFTDPYFPALIQNISLTASQNDYAIMLWVGDSAEEEDRFSDRILDNRFFDGVLIASAVDDDPLLKRLAGTNVPYVLIGPPQQGARYYVDVDNRNAACHAVSHLINLGYRRIATISGVLRLGAARARLQGYRDALCAAGIEVDERLIVEGHYDEPSGYQRMLELIPLGVDAVFCASDVMALGALRAAASIGLRVPGDVAIVGFDDIPFTSTNQPALTTVSQPIAELGSMATQMLIRLIDGAPVEQPAVVLPAHLIIRSTCGANERSMPRSEN